MLSRRWLILASLAVLCIAGCRVTTDKQRYGTGEAAEATFTNPLSIDTFVETCLIYSFEKLEGETWVPSLPWLSCDSLGARRVAPKSRLSFPFVAPERGTWRLRVNMGVVCNENGPIHECRWSSPLHSKPFEVVSPGGECVVGGCSGELCADQPLLSGCWYSPEFACYHDASCGRFGDPSVHGGCGWNLTQELRDCLAKYQGPSDRCIVGGCSGQLCVDSMSAIFTTCDWWPEYACYGDAVCGQFGDPEVQGGCAWQQTPELLGCLEENEGSPFTPVDLGAASGSPQP